MHTSLSVYCLELDMLHLGFMRLYFCWNWMLVGALMNAYRHRQNQNSKVVDSKTKWLTFDFMYTFSFNLIPSHHIFPLWQPAVWYPGRNCCISKWKASFTKSDFHFKSLIKQKPLNGRVKISHTLWGVESGCVPEAVFSQSLSQTQLYSSSSHCCIYTPFYYQLPGTAAEIWR